MVSLQPISATSAYPLLPSQVVSICDLQWLALYLFHAPGLQLDSCFAVNGPATWNRLPPALRSPDRSESAFKWALKTHLISTAQHHWDVFMILTLDNINIQTYLFITYEQFLQVCWLESVLGFDLAWLSSDKRKVCLSFVSSYSGLPLWMQVTEFTANELGEKFEFEHRGTVFVKGKGDMNTYLLVRKKDGATWEWTACAVISPLTSSLRQLVCTLNDCQCVVSVCSF